MPDESSTNPAADWTVRIRMYRQGLGDCFLVTLKSQAALFHMLIDCGVILGQAKAGEKVEAVVADIAKTTGSHLNLLVATHEHWDHISGFVQATAQFKALTIDEVWLGWTEDPNDPVARSLVKTRAEAVTGLRLGAAQLRMAGDGRTAGEVDSLLGFFGAAGRSTADALEEVRGLTPNPRYVRPTDAPVLLGETGVRAYVLGPPLDLKLLKKSTPSSGQSYGFDAVDVFASDMAPGMGEGESRSPFSSNRVIPMPVAETQPFFREHYFSVREARRRLDGAWLSGLSDVALKLDSNTNNTSVVLALELPSKEVLLFTADAQIGSWLSWQDLKWTIEGEEVTGPDLLRRVTVYKVGHHGSHNATLKPKGLEAMEALKYALLPVDAAMATKKGWGRMPLPDIVERLEKATKGRVVRIDSPAPTGAGAAVVETDVYFDLFI